MSPTHGSRAGRIVAGLFALSTLGVAAYALRVGAAGAPTVIGGGIIAAAVVAYLGKHGRRAGEIIVGVFALSALGVTAYALSVGAASAFTGIGGGALAAVVAAYLWKKAG